MATTTRVRLADFLLNPDIDESRLELIDGEVTEKPMPTWDHGSSAGRIFVILEELGFTSIEVRAVIEVAGAAPLPDVAFYREKPTITDGYMRQPPNVAVEILSPGPSMPFMRRKAALYFSFGVESVWMIDQERSEIHLLEDGKERLLRPGDRVTTPSVPGLDVDVLQLLPRKL